MEQLDKAEKLLETKNHEGALELFLYIIKEYPSDARAYQGIAQCHYALGRYEEATEACNTALEIEPDLSIPHTILAFIYGRKGNLEKSRDEAKVAFELAPKSFDAINCYGTVLIAEGKYVEAETLLQKASQINPNSMQTHQNLAIAYEKIGNTRKYFEETRTLYKMRPSVKNGFRFLLAFQRRHALPISILVTSVLVFTLVLRIKALLLIPGLYAVWGGSLCYQFAKERKWRATIIYLIATMVYIGLLYSIYTVVAQ